MTIAARANPDGYTILVASSSFVVNPSLYAKNPYDAFKDFEPVTLAAASPNILVVNPELPVKTVKELVDLLKANPYKYPIANPGIGTTPQLAAELFKLALKLEATSVPFGGAAPAIQSTVANQTPIAFAAMPPAAPQVTGGKLRALAVTSAKRSSALPDVPTLAESGIKEQESETMQGVFVPAKTPKAIVDQLNAEIVKAMAMPDVKAKCAQLGFDPVANTPQEFAGYIKKEVEKWGNVIEEAKIRRSNNVSARLNAHRRYPRDGGPAQIDARQFELRFQRDDDVGGRRDHRRDALPASRFAASPSIPPAATPAARRCGRASFRAS